MSSRSVIVAAVRTPFGRLAGGLASYPATELGAFTIRAALERTGIEPREPQYVIMGMVLQGGAGQGPARQAAIGAGLPKETPSDTINKLCASSIRAVEIADSMIRAGDVELVVTGGMESMTNTPYALPKARLGSRPRSAALISGAGHQRRNRSSCTLPMEPSSGAGGPWWSGLSTKDAPTPRPAASTAPPATHNHVLLLVRTNTGDELGSSCKVTCTVLSSPS